MSDAMEKKLATSLATSFSGEAETEVEVDIEIEPASYDFDDEFQMKIGTLAVRDYAFAKKTQGLIEPSHFENSAVATLVNLTQQHWQTYSELPSTIALSQILKDALLSGKIRRDLKDDVVATFRAMIKGDISDRDFVADKVAEFARHQAIYKAMMQSADMMSKGQYDKIAEMVKKAASVGISQADLAYDYFAEIETRTTNRKDKMAGVKPPEGITTGLKKIDKLLYHNGWGRKELSILMGGAKSGKSTGLLFFARNSAMAGFNTLYVTLEMSAEIASSRIDASISEVEMKELDMNNNAVREAVIEAGKKSGALFMAQMPGYSLTPMGLRRLIDSYAAEGTRFDLVVVDYLDLMAPDFRSNSDIENSKNIYVGVRAIGQEENIAILSATQTNREGFKSVTAKAEHAADDFNKIRIADLTISINATDDEKDRGEARLYFAASRNEASGITVQIKQQIDRMIFIKSVIGMI